MRIPYQKHWTNRLKGIILNSSYLNLVSYDSNIYEKNTKTEKHLINKSDKICTEETFDSKFDHVLEPNPLASNS